MSPTSLGANPLATPSIPVPPHIPDNWQNPAPETWKQLDGRQHYLQAQSRNLFLEMHPNATRGVANYTKYCVLSIFILNLTTNGSQGIKFSGWSSDRNKKPTTWTSHTTPLHIIQSNSTSRFLCMDDKSDVYQSDKANFSYHHCAFRHEYQSPFTDRYYRLINNSVKWYLGMNKDGSILCGNRTIKQTKRINFTKGISDEGRPAMTEPAPVNHRDAKRTCCENKQCRKAKKRRSKCRKKDWCRSFRRRFFKLSLKELRKYFNHCVKKIRHCKQNKPVDR